MRLIDADALMTELMDSDLDHLQRDDWREVIQIVTDAQTVNPDSGPQKLADEIAKFKRTMRSDNSDYFTGYMSALSMVEGMIADMMPHEPYEGVTE